MYTIEVESNFAELWRYNIMIMCGGYSATSEHLYTSKFEEIVSTLDEPLKCEPDEYKLPHMVTLKCDKADNIRLLIYLVPHTLPFNDLTEESPPFDLMVKITKNRKRVYNTLHHVNQWSGASIEIKL